MSKSFGHGKFLLAVATFSLAAYAGSSGAGAATVRQAQDSRAVHAGRISPVVWHGAHRAGVPHRQAAPQGCTTVAISQNVAYDLEEPTQSATAAMVISAPGTYSALNVDGTGCDIGIYIASGVQGVTVSDDVVHDATRAGIVADATNMTTLLGDSIYNIGDHTGSTFTPDGVQYGFSVLSDTSTNVAMQNVDVTQYQKGGFLVFSTTGSMTSDVATGSGPIDYIGQNGFEVAASEFSSFTNNTSMLNQYTGPIYGASGYILCGVTVNGVLLTPSLGVRQHLPGDVSLFNDIPYYIEQSPDC